MENKQTKIIRRRYNRFSYIYDFLEWGLEKRYLHNWRNNLLRELKGKILEVGVGTGKNLEYYNSSAKVTGIDLSPKMLARAKKKLKLLDRSNIVLKEMNAQDLIFRDNSFDYVVCTFVLCSVPDPVSAIKEMKRVLKVGGRMLMLEHTKSDYILIKIFQHIHNPLTRVLFGFNVNRDTLRNIEKTGLNPEYINLAAYDVFKRVEVTK